MLGNAEGIIKMVYALHTHTHTHTYTVAACLWFAIEVSSGQKCRSFEGEIAPRGAQNALKMASQPQ